VIGLGREARDRFITIPDGLDLMPLGIEAAAAIAVRQCVGVAVLKNLGHDVSFMGVVAVS
jgi:hypothetical protein